MPKDKPIITEQISQDKGPVIKPEDLLSISVVTLNPESNMLFNTGVLLPVGGSTGMRQQQQGGNNDATQGYLVDDQGYIEFPVLGRVKVAGLTREEANNKLTADLQEYLQEPIVKVRYLNFRVTVIGEVSNPSVVTAMDDNMNIIEALGMAGDLTLYGKREDVLVIREENGTRTMARLNLNDSNVFKSPYFNLHQNDVIYVEPDKAKVAGTGFVRRNWGFAVGIVSTALFLFVR
ncbi:polysaccharide biosynthesis/export family protein [Pontibacter diazotrophicus]|uniref:polysaccharide biosynthesis/export family protein n=1 Tax=Pontibacter diazotrophicus TaxID=1400979 RepID=UPI001FE587AC|nr:polysaccharide biosynthesis/export family protein [Pontibacter diazotrophicus]